MTKLDGAEGVVEHQFEAGRPGRRQVDRVDQCLGVVLEGPRREPDVADLPGQHPAEVLTVVQALDLALGRLVDVDPVLVEEAQHDRLGVMGVEPDRHPGRAGRRCHLEPGHRARWRPRGRRR